MTSPSVKKRKASALLDPDASSHSSIQSRITSYGRLSKAQALLASKGAEKGLDLGTCRAVTSVTCPGSQAREEVTTPLRKKRKRDILLGVAAGEAATTHLGFGDQHQEGAEISESADRDVLPKSPEGATEGQATACQEPAQKKRKQLEKSLTTTVVTSSTPKPKKSAADRGQSLLERIRAKQRQQAHLPPPPSKAEIDRRSALERLFEIVPVLNFLTLRHHHHPRGHQEQATLINSTTISTTSTSKSQSPKGPPQKFSAPLPTVVQHLQGSLRNPLSKDEAELSVKLLAQEIASSWCQVVTMGKIKAVVLHRGHCPSVLEIKERIGCALASNSASSTSSV